ncbi:hypothetical protein E6B08_10640 [Pseudomonas putida]|uniref:Uncharacterized protein n=1 Tax=Pseudomonas putida TaxID=303 RepID=A0A4D6X701_PSEPU|nr:hypothetical protein E6B08_10640 [Pseudomonas putida]
MAIDTSSPNAPHPGPVDTGHGSGLEKAKSEPKHGTEGASPAGRPADWTPPPGNPGSDQDSQTGRDNAHVRSDGEREA